MSSVASLAVHASLAAAVLFGTARSGRSTPVVQRDVALVVPYPLDSDLEPNGAVLIPGLPPVPNLAVIPVPPTVLQSGAQPRTVVTGYAPSPAAAGSGGAVDVWGSSLGETAGPQILTGPLPLYPELLRRAGVQGQVVLEAVVDSTGHVLPASIKVISATNDGFVAAARHALVATLFRPAQVAGRPVRMLVRVPFDFAIRGGTGRAR